MGTRVGVGRPLYAVCEFVVSVFRAVVAFRPGAYRWEEKVAGRPTLESRVSSSKGPAIESCRMDVCKGRFVRFYEFSSGGPMSRENGYTSKRWWWQAASLFTFGGERQFPLGALVRFGKRPSTNLNGLGQAFNKSITTIM